MAGRIWIGPYKPLGVSTQAVPGGGYIKVDTSVGQFGGSVLGGLDWRGTDGDAGMAGAVSEHLANDNVAVVKAADVRLGEAERTLLFDPQNGYLNAQGQAALTKAPEVLNTYREALDHELAETADEDQRDMLRGLNEGRLADFTTLVERHTAAERQRWYDEAGDRRIAQMRAEAGLHWSDDAMLRRALGTTRFEVRDKAERHGWDAPLTEAALRQHTSRTLVAAIEAAVERDPDRAQAVRTRYDQHIEAADRAALDALLSEAHTRQRTDAASAEILNATSSDSEQPTPQWRLRQAEAIAEPAVRAATIRRVLSADAANQARARALAERVLARVLKDGLTDPSQIPVREWVTLDAEHRRAIETRLDHNAQGTEPAPNPALVDELATEMTRVPDIFVRRDLLPAVAHLALPQWQRFRDRQAGLRRNDPATEDQIYAIKRGLQLANKTLPAEIAQDEATKVRAGLVEDIDTQRRITGKSLGDSDIIDMLARHVPAASGATHTREGDPRHRPEIHQVRSDTTTYGPSVELLKWLLRLGIGIEANRALNDAMRSMSKGVLDDTKAVAEATGLKLADGHPSRIRRDGEDVYFNPRTGRYLVRNKRGGPGYWAEFDARGEFVGVVGDTLVHGTSREQLSPAQVKKWTQPETFPIGDPPPPLPGFEPTPLPKWQEGITAVPPPPPLPGFSLPEIVVPPYLEAEEHEHHHIPQYLWSPRARRNPNWKPKYKFSDDVIEAFDGLTVSVPKGEHWGRLHYGYSREVGRQLQAYLELKAEEHKTTPEDYAAGMGRTEALEWFEAMKIAIRNPDYTKFGTEEEATYAQRAKEFLDKTLLYQREK